MPSTAARAQRSGMNKRGDSGKIRDTLGAEPGFKRDIYDGSENDAEARARHDGSENDVEARARPVLCS
jgi:hypothetical protein